MSRIALTWNVPGLHVSTKLRAGDLMIACMGGLAAPLTIAVMASAGVASHSSSVMAYNVLVGRCHESSFHFIPEPEQPEQPDH
jgi:hypothetical protein